MRLPKEVSDRIAMLRPILIIGVVFVHIPGISDLPSEFSPSLFNWFAAFFKNGVFRGTVPTMSLIAGYLLFSAGLDLVPAKLFKKKLATLLVPFIVFNVACYGFELFMHSVFASAFSELRFLPASPMELMSAIFGFNSVPINAPLYFIRDMLVIIALVPFLSLILRHAPWLGLAALAILCGTNADGDLLFRSSSLFLFYIGGAAAVYKWNLFALDKYAAACLTIFLGMCAVIIGMRIDDNTFLVVVAPFLIWPSARLLQHTKIETAAIKFTKYSFFIFVGHTPLLRAMWWLVVHEARWIPYPVFWLAAPWIICAILKKTYDVASAVAPDIFNAAIGTRVKAPLLVERRKTARAANAPIYSSAGRAALRTAVVK